MRTPLSHDQRRLLREKLRTLLNQGQAQHVGLLGEQAPDWSRSRWVLGSSEDVTHTDIKQPCAGCSERVYTSVRYPHDIAVVCEVCLFEQLVLQEAAVA